MKRPRFRATPTTYKGIEMRSRLEAGYAAWLDKQGWDWEYEPNAFACEDGQYLPDFKIEGVTNLITGQRSCAYIETKPNFTDQPLKYLAQRMAVILESEPDAQVLLQAPAEPYGSDCGSARLALRPSGTGMNFNGWSYLFALGRVGSKPLQWVAVMWMWTRERTPTLGVPVPIDLGPWAGEYWDINASDLPDGKGS